MSKKPAGKRRKTDSESLSSIINEINDITSAECSKSRKTRPTRPARSKATDIEIQRDETGQRIFHSRRLLSQSSWARGRDKNGKKDENPRQGDENPRQEAPGAQDMPDELDLDGTVDEFINSEQDLEDVIEECQKVVGRGHCPSAWQKRMINLDENWQSVRETIFENVVSSFDPPHFSIPCCKCSTNEALLRCWECGVNRFLCVNCDDEVHQSLPFHNREVWLNGYFQYILPTETVSDEKKVTHVDRSCPLLHPKSCLSCNEPTVKKLESTMVVFITSEGRFDLNWFNVYCSSCAWKWSPNSISSIIQSGFWPGSPMNVNTFYDQKLFFLWDAFRKQMPGSSQTAFIRSLEELSHSKNRVNVINASTFRKAFAEWCYCQFELDSLQNQNWQKCPPCSVEQHSCHVDGNHKVYRFKKVSRGNYPSYYCDYLISDNAKVDSHIKNLSQTGNRNEVQKENNACGDTHWKAAKAVSKSKKNQDETGLVVAGCRHSISQAALNMFRGEVYGYTHYLHLNFIQPNKVKFLWQDVICKYWPWAQRVASGKENMALENTKPALSLMHGKSHSWTCQVIWSGRWQEGASATAGEEVEQINSYLSRLGSTTKNMTASGREDCITEHLLSWNRRKIINLPKTLVLRLKTTEKKLVDAKNDLNRFTSDLGLSDEDVNASVMLWKQDVQQFAMDQQRGKNGEIGDLGEFYLLHHTVQNAQHLTEFVNANDDQTRIMLGNQKFHQFAADKTKDLDKNMARMRALKTSLLSRLCCTEEDILAQGKVELAKVTVTGLQMKLEMLYFSIARRLKEISSLADSSKRRSSMRLKCSKEKAEILSSVEALNTICQLLALPPTRSEDILEGNFPWSFEGEPKTSQDIPIRCKAQVVDRFMLVERLKEEKSQLRMEMKNFLMFYLETILPSLREKKVSINTRIAYINNVDEPDDKYSNEEKSGDDKGRRYSVRTERQDTLQGHLAIVNMGIAFAKNQIRNGLSYFGDLNNSLAYLQDGEDDISSDEDEDEDDTNSSCEDALLSDENTEHETFDD